jgi:hypothetical protein
MTMVYEVTMAPPHELYGSLEALLSPQALSRIERRTVTSVQAEPCGTSEMSASGSLFVRVSSDGDDGARRHYVVKRTSYARDIIMRLSGDTVCREVLVWQRGLLDRLPPEVMSPTVGAAIDGDGWALLMADVSDALPPYTGWPHADWQPATAEQTRRLLHGMAALHERYWEDPALLDPSLGLCSLPWLYEGLSPKLLDGEAGSPHRIVPAFQQGWALLDEVAPPDIAALVRTLHRDSRPLCAALERYPRTLVHGDLKCANLGVEPAPNGRVVLLDWQFVTCAPPSVDLSWFLAMFTTVLPCSLDEAIEEYRATLARRLGSRFDERWWQPQLDVGLLGQFLRMGHMLMSRTAQARWAPFHEHYRTMLTWWYEHMRAGAAWL